MSTRNGYWVILICDYCRTEFGTPGEYGNVADLRAKAASAGWRTVNLGSKQRRHADVCPVCSVNVCSACKGKPPVGFTCNVCGASSDGGAAAPVLPPLAETMGRCPVCKEIFPVKANGKFRSHKANGYFCHGSRMKPLPVEDARDSNG